MNEIDFSSNDDANDNMIVNNDFFVKQYSEQKKITSIYFFVTFFARNTFVRSELNSYKSRQNSLFSFFLINRIFTSFFEYVQWTRQNASAIFRENKKNSKITTEKNAISNDSKTYVKFIIIKANKITEMRKNFLHKCKYLTYSNESTQLWKKKLNKIYETKNKSAVKLYFANLFYVLWNKNLCSKHYKIIKWFLNLKCSNISKLILKNLNDFWRAKKIFTFTKKIIQICFTDK